MLSEAKRLLLVMLSEAKHLAFDRALALSMTFCVALLVAGCRQTQRSAPASTAISEKALAAPNSAPFHGHYSGLSNDGTYFLTYTPSPDPIPLNRMFGLQVQVFTPSVRSTPLRNIALHADAAMPEHDHGMNTKPKVHTNPDGSFTVTGMQFHMPGRWELYLDVTQGGVTERAQFTIQLD